MRIYIVIMCVRVCVFGYISNSWHSYLLGLKRMLNFIVGIIYRRKLYVMWVVRILDALNGIDPIHITTTYDKYIYKNTNNNEQQ